MRRKVIVPFLIGGALLVAAQAALADPPHPPNFDPNWVPGMLKNEYKLPLGRTWIADTGIAFNVYACAQASPDCVAVPSPQAINPTNGAGKTPFGDTGRIVLGDTGISIQPNMGTDGVTAPPAPDPNWYGWYLPTAVHTTRFTVPTTGLRVDPLAGPTGVVTGVSVDPNWFVPNATCLQPEQPDGCHGTTK